MINRPGFAQVGKRPLRSGSGAQTDPHLHATGDDGTTGLVGGQRVRKNTLRIEAYGTVDELSAVIGLARTALADVLRTRPVQDIAARTRSRASSTRGWRGRKTRSSTSAAISRRCPRTAGRGCP